MYSKVNHGKPSPRKDMERPWQIMSRLHWDLYEWKEDSDGTFMRTSDADNERVVVCSCQKLVD